MGKASRQKRAGERAAPSPGPPQYYGPPQGNQWMLLATLGGVVALLMISFSNWREIDRIDRTLEGRLDKLDSRIGQLATKVDKLTAQVASQRTRRGPDPNRVYQVKTAGAPSKGPLGAAVTIAEFSDFQ